MTIQHSCVTLVFLATWMRVVCATASASSLSIKNISVPSTVDLYSLYNFDFEDSSQLDPYDLFRWQIYDGNKPISRDSSSFSTSIEIMTGPAGASESDVVDIAGINASNDILYSLPASLPLGLYHARINTTVQTKHSSGEFTTRRATASSPTINVTASHPIGCGVKDPAPYSNITSPSSSKFTSLYIYEPSAGANIPRDPDSRINDRDEMYIGWDFRNERNLDGAGISNITIQIIDSATSKPIGPLQKPLTLYEHWLKFSEVPMEIGKFYGIELKYHNDVRDGAVSPGKVVTYRTQDFILVTPDNYDKKCPEPPAPGSSPGPNPSPGNPNNPNTADNGLARPHSYVFWFLLAASQTFL